MAQAENFRRLGFRNVLPISAEHGSGIGDLLDEVFEVLPEPTEVIEEPEVMLTEDDEAEEDENGPDFALPLALIAAASTAERGGCGRMASMRAARRRSPSSGGRMWARARC